MIRLKTKKAAKEQHVSWLVVRFSFLSASHGQLLAMIWGAKKGGTQIYLRTPHSKDTKRHKRANNTEVV